MRNTGILVPVAMVATACTEVGISTIMKAAMRQGMTQFVYVAYSNVFGVLILSSCSFFFYRKRQPPLTRRIVLKIALMGLLSCGVQMFMNTGIRYSSPSMSAAMTDLTPAFTFSLAVLSRMEKLECKLRSSQAKSIGTFVSVIGALIVTFYKGLPLTALPSESTPLNLSLHASNWAIGGILCATGAVCLSLLYIVQTWILRDFPHELLVACISCCYVAAISTIIGVIAENNLESWILRPDIESIAIACSAIFAVSLRGVVHTWSCAIKGPLYTAMFNPLGMIIATFLGVTFLGDTLYIGSVIGGCIIAVGFYTVLWGKHQEEKVANKEKKLRVESASSAKVPLLQDRNEDV